MHVEEWVNVSGGRHWSTQERLFGIFIECNSLHIEKDVLMQYAISAAAAVFLLGTVALRSRGPIYVAGSFVSCFVPSTSMHNRNYNSDFRFFSCW